MSGVRPDDGYPQDRETLVKYLDSAIDALVVLSDALHKKNTLTPETSRVKKVKAKKISKMAASKGEASSDSAKDLQQWYTIEELAEECMDKFKTHCADIWQNENAFYMEPSAGEGDILEKLPEGRRFGVDLEPKHPEVRRMNFFDTSREVMGINDETPLALIGNPPFGDVASAFFDHATNVLRPEYIAWILPNSFISRARRNKINPHYHLIYVMNITCCYVHKGKLYNLATMFGIWKKSNIPLDIPITVLSSPDFELITSKKAKEEIYQREKNGDLERNNKQYFWMRNTIQHINTVPQVPTRHSGQEILDTYANTAMRTSTPHDKLLGCFCIKCPSPEKYDSVFSYFSNYNWKNQIGQFASGRGTKDWEILGRICISKTHVYSAYNNDLGFQPYRDSIRGMTHTITQEQSGISREDVVTKYENRPSMPATKSRGGKRAKKTRRKKRR